MSGLAGRGGAGRRNVDLVQGFFGRLGGGDPESLADVLDPEVDVMSAKGLAGAGEFHGLPGYHRWLARWSAAWERESIWVAMIEPVGTSHVIAMVRQRAKGSAPGEGEATVTYMWELRGGHIKRLHAYPTRKAAVNAARGGHGGDGE